ncbi:hypothetical protein F4815DRAFT_444250 [Daldinia loculata]|nr:hypothetical protein F4815DRAFT_444250 [Daldinia loculata]
MSQAMNKTWRHIFCTVALLRLVIHGRPANLSMSWSESPRYPDGAVSSGSAVHVVIVEAMVNQSGVPVCILYGVLRE